MTRFNEICHVCGMRAHIDVPSLQYHKMYYHFCSIQCRETFITHPNLYSVTERCQRKEILKHRTMRLAEKVDSKTTELLMDNLTEMMGVKAVSIEGDTISISYDLLQVARKQIENKLVEIGIGLGNDWVERLRRAWLHNSEENELDNMAAPVHYYHRPSAKCK